MISLIFLSGCGVVMSTYDMRPSVAEKAIIRATCLSDIYGCGVNANSGNICTNEMVNPKNSTPEDRHNKIELEACMTHYQEHLRDFFSFWSSTTIYKPTEAVKNPKNSNVEGSD